MKLLLSIAAIACLAGSATAAPRQHPEGFSLDLPADWKFSESNMTMGTRWVAGKIDPKDDKIGAILSVYVVLPHMTDSTITGLAEVHKIPDLTWTSPQRTTFDGIPGTKRTGKAKHYDFTAFTLETTKSKGIVVVAMQLGADRQHRLELDLILNSIKRVPIKSTTFPLSDGVVLDLPTTWATSNDTAPKPFNGMEWMLMSNDVKKAPKAVIFARAIDTDKLDAGIKVLEDEDKKDLGAITWGPASTTTVNGVRATTRLGKQGRDNLTLTIVETSAATRWILWSLAIGDPALEPQLRAVLGTLRKR